MSNVHGIGALGGGDRPRRNQRPRDEDGEWGGGFMPQEPITPENIRLANEHRVIFVSGSRALKDPRQQNYWDMLVYGLCPSFKFLSFTFLVVLADIAMFIYLVAEGLDKTSDNLLQVKAQTLIDNGGNYQPKDLDGQVYRFLSAIFLHVNFMHIFGNIIVTFLFLSRIEYTFGVPRTVAIYLLSGIVANVFSVLLQPEGVKAGASTSLYGIIGVIIGYIVINCSGLDVIGPILKCQVYCTAFMVIIFIFLFTPSSDDIDYWGHLGGFLAGLFLSCLGTTIVDNKRERIFRIVFGCLFVIMAVVCFVVFYTTQQSSA